MEIILLLFSRAYVMMRFDGDNMYIENFEDVIAKTNIKVFLHTDDIIKGKKYDKDKITLMEEKESRNANNIIDYYHFEVDAEDKNTYFDVSIMILDNKSIYRTSCDCRNYRIRHSCEHIAAVFANFYDQFFQKSLKHLTNLSNDLLNRFLPDEKLTIKKELNVLLNLSVLEENNYYYYGTYKRLNVKMLIGDNKLYTLGNHAKEFKTVHDFGEGEVYFGKSFTYNPNNYYISEEDEIKLDAYFNLTDGYQNRFFPDSEIKKFLNKLKNSSFILDDYQIDGITEGFGIQSKLVKIDDLYELSFDLDHIKTIITDDYEYILYKGRMYHLNKKAQDLLEELFKNDLNKLMINKDQINVFNKGLLKVVKKNLNIDENIKDIVLTKDIKTEIYFDLRTNYILVEPKFIYDLETVSYFDTNNNVLRDMDFEVKVINELLKYGFKIDKNQIILDDLELEVAFLENGLEEIASKYPVFTTEKFKKMSIRKKTNVSSMFKIGQDNIFKFDFNLGDIKSEELVNIFKEMKGKRKYYRLKNGDILSLEDENLNNLRDISEDLELSDEDIIRGNGKILKYRAIYLDSLKKNKYNNITTNNLFDEFINNFYTFKNANLTLNKDDLSILRDYQITGIKWLYNLAKTGFGGILADEMGLGKTIQVIYYLKQMLKDNNSSLFLIVVPTSLAYNWDHEFLLYGSDIKRIVCLGSKEKRKKLLENLKDTNVVITTYGLLREDEELYQKYHFNTMIIDEAQNIKNYMAGITKCVKKISADTKFALTGTPLENNVLELWSIFDYIMPGYLSSFNNFQVKYKIKDFDDDTLSLINGLSHQINPFILRRKKKDVIKELPDKLINDIYIDLSEKQKQLYVAELEDVKEKMQKIMAEEGISKARFMILQLITKLRQICIDPKIIYENYDGGSNKLDQLETIIKEYIDNNHKILIFSSFKTALNIVKDRLIEKKIPTFMIDGSIPAKTRVDMVEEFNQSNSVNVFLIMLKSGGTGLNLASADVVIHLDLWWNPQAENQATDRAHRIGQKNKVEVIHLITKGTIEEKILDLQNKKRILSDKLIDGEVRDKNLISELSKEDIENLLAYENKN